MTRTEPTPAEIFLHLIVTFLTPMFLTATGRDITHARMAATEAVNAYGARTYLDLLPIAQVIGFGLATLDSLNRSMNEALPTAFVLRLRTNAASLNRAAEQCRRALRAPADTRETWPEPEPSREAGPRQTPEETLPAEPNPEPLTTTTAQAGTPTLAIPPATPAPTMQAAATQPATTTPSTIQPATTTPTDTQPTTRTAWAAAMTDVAREYTTGLTNLPPAERHQASMRAAALSSVAQHLLSSAPMPPSPLSAPFRLPSHRRP